jgi:hypothetical protein
MAVHVEQGVRGGADRLAAPEIASAHKTGAIIRVNSLSELTGSQLLPIMPAQVSYDQIGRILRGEEKRRGKSVEMTLSYRERGLAEDVVGTELYPVDRAHRSIELSHRTLRKVGEAQDKVPVFHVNTRDKGHFEVLYFPEGSQGAKITVPRNVERLSDGQYISDLPVVTFDLAAGDMVAMSGLPYALSPKDQEVGYLYASSDSHLQYPGHRNPAVFPVEIVGERNSTHADVLYVRGHAHRGLIGGRLDGLSGPETSLARSKYKSLRELADVDVVDLRHNVEENEQILPDENEVTVFAVDSQQKEKVSV